MAADDEGRRPPILVTGATGFAGGHLALRLRKNGHQVRAFVRPTGKTDHLQAAGVELVTGDIRNRADVVEAAAGVEKIYHIAAVFRTASHPDSYYEDVNVGGTLNVLEAARQHGVARTIHCSTIGVHGDVQEFPCTEDSPFNPGDMYQRTKLEGENAAQAAFKAGLPGVVFRPAGMYGPGDLRFLKLFKSVNDGRFIMFGSGETFYHLVYADDLDRRHPALRRASRRPWRHLHHRRRSLGLAERMGGRDRQGAGRAEAPAARAVLAARHRCGAVRGPVQALWHRAADPPPPRLVLHQAPRLLDREGAPPCSAMRPR